MRKQCDGLYALAPAELKALPIVEVICEPSEPDQACRSCGGGLEPMAGQFEEADVIAVDETWWRLMKKAASKLREATLRAVQSPLALARDLESSEP